MKNNIERLMHFAQHRAPTPDEPGYDAIMSAYSKRAKSNPNTKKELKKKFENVLSIARTQGFNGIGLAQDQELRYFHQEFNERIWKYGFAALPSSFNVLEGFFRWNPELFYFELMEEEEHLFSVFDFFDFVTSDNCSNSVDYFIENVDDEIIYNYNILNNAKDITFSTKDSIEYVLGGVSFVKRGPEVFMLIVAGEIGTTKKFKKESKRDRSDYEGKSYLKSAKNRKEEAVRLLGLNDVWKVNIYVRIDLNRKTIDLRYIQKDEGVRFSTITDDYGMLENSISDKVALEAYMQIEAKEIAKYDAIFEAAYCCLYLPEYFDFFDVDTLAEEHPTGLASESLKKPISTKEIRFDRNYFRKNKDVWVLDRRSNPPENITMKTSELQIEKDGFWRILESGKLGVGKNGESIHNRTWVEKTLSWYESSPDRSSTTPPEIGIHKSNKRGYIYILHNPAHELDLFKIGLTTKSVEERAGQLSGTPSPDKFLIAHRWLVDDCVLAETLIHNELQNYRINPKREFFKIHYEIALKLISPIVERINMKNVTT